MQNYDILDTPREEEFDEIVKLASQFCETPIALISLVDEHRQWFKSKIGLDVSETPLSSSICRHAIRQSDTFVIEDTTKDERLSDNPLVTGDPGLRFYAGTQLQTDDGLPLGMLCVLDYKPRELTELQLFTLKALARQVMTRLEYRRSLKEKEATKRKLDLAFYAPELTGFWNWNLETDLVITDESFARIYGVDPVIAAKGAPVEEYIKYIHPDDIGRVMQAVRMTIEQGVKYAEVYRLVQPDGSARWLAARGFRHDDANGTPISFEGVSIDITERKKVEEALREKDLSLRTALQAGQMGTWELNVERAFLSCSETCNANYGLKPQEELTYQTLISLVHEDDRAHWQTTVADAIGTASDFEMEYRIRWADGTIHWIYVRGSCTMAVNGKAATISGVSIDITQRKRLETEAREAREKAEAANRAKTEFLANMSHEIRTPMNAVVGLSHILAMSQPLAPKQKEYIKTLQTSADSLLSLINDLLDIAKIEARSVELEHIPFSIVRIVQETISMMNVRAREKNLAFEMKQDCACIEKRQMLGDPTRIRQILLNLCSNAIKFTETGGVSVHISCELIEDTNKEIISIAVKDTGIGIAPEKTGDIFRKFTQADSSINRKYGGTGLGLAITSTLTEIMGGTIHVKSEPGTGSTFTVTLPLDIAAPHGDHPPGEIVQETTVAAFHNSFKARILLVEDYAPNVMVATVFLEQFGYAVDIAGSGLEAIEKIKNYDYVAVLMDVQMHGMNGLEATQHIRAHEKQSGRSKLHIIGMTAHALAGDRERCLLAGMDDYISKPFSPEKLRKMLSQLTEEPVM